MYSSNNLACTHRHKTQSILNQIDLEVLECRHWGVLVQQKFCSPGPDHLWSADFHEKLQEWWNGIYGFINAWLQCILALFVHVTNHDPPHINLYYLEMVWKRGGFLHYLHINWGTETGDMAAICASLDHFFGDFHNLEDPTRQKYTKPVHNQEIKFLESINVFS